MEYKAYISELEKLTDAMTCKPQTVGFVHGFFVPGWIGAVQEWIVESKMSNAAQQPIYKGLNYYECGDKIAELIDKACVSLKSEEGYSEENSRSANLLIIDSASRAIDAWVSIYPEIAHWMNRHIGDDYVTCILGIVQSKVKKSLSEIMEIPEDRRELNTNTSFSHEMKAISRQLVATVCNVITVGVILSLLAAIFG